MTYPIRNKFVLLLFISLMIGSTAVLEASDFHVMLITDLNADRIEAGIKKDLLRMQKTIRLISKHTGLTLKEKLFVGKKTDPQELFAHLRSLQVNSDDVILFYFSGHGYRTDQNPDNIWPILAFEKASIGIEFEEIVTFLQKKQARLTLMFADCCNNTISSKSQKRDSRVLFKGTKTELDPAYCKLFLESKGLLVVASAKPGEYSYTSNLEGSLYSIAFTKTLKDITKLPLEQISWSTIIESAKSKLAKVTTLNHVEQHPIENNAIVEN